MKRVKLSRTGLEVSRLGLGGLFVASFSWEQNAAAAKAGSLPADILKRLAEIAALVPFRPFGEPFGIGWLMGNPAGYKGQGQG
jgi:hypothetical protein